MKARDLIFYHSFICLQEKQTVIETSKSIYHIITENNKKIQGTLWFNRTLWPLSTAPSVVRLNPQIVVLVCQAGAVFLLKRKQAQVKMALKIYK